jgi:hypothetical protein
MEAVMAQCNKWDAAKKPDAKIIVIQRPYDMAAEE